MPSAPSPNPRVRQRFGRVIALALFALQAAVALSPLAERAQSGRPQAHVEERGAIHRYVHDESTCALCAVRSLHAAVQARTSSGSVAPEAQRASTFVALVVPTPDGVAGNHSRAPPLAG